MGTEVGEVKLGYGWLCNIGGEICYGQVNLSTRFNPVLFLFGVQVGLGIFY